MLGINKENVKNYQFCTYKDWLILRITGKTAEYSVILLNIQYFRLICTQ